MEQIRENNYDDGVLFGINNCNAEFQTIFNQMYREFNDLKRITKSNMIEILIKYRSIHLGDDVNPFLENTDE